MLNSKEIEIDGININFPTNAAERLYEELKKIIGNGTINRSNAVVILLSLMQVVEKYEDINGEQKKAIIIDALNHLIDDQINNYQEAMEMKLLVKITLPSVIDTFVSIDKKEIQIKIKKNCFKFLSCCISNNKG